MTFEEIVDQAIAMLQRRSRVTYRMLKRQCALDDGALDDLRLELIKGRRLAADEDGDVLVWIGAAAAPSPAADVAVVPAHTPKVTPLTYTPSHLTEKSLAARPAHTDGDARLYRRGTPHPRPGAAHARGPQSTAARW